MIKHTKKNTYAGHVPPRAMPAPAPPQPSICPSALHQTNGGQTVQSGHTLYSSHFSTPTEPDPQDGWAWLTKVFWALAIGSVIFAATGGISGMLYGCLNR